MRRLHARWLTLWLGALAPACSTHPDDCSCSIEVATERRSLACGASACVDGVLLACVNQAEIAQRGACSPGKPSVSMDQPSMPDTEQTTPPDTSCAELATYCGSSCRSPASASADCQATASAQDADACRQWLLVNGVLCRP